MDMIERALLPDGGDISIAMPPLDEVARLWPIIEPRVKRATDRERGFEPIDILRLVMAQQMTMFVIRDQGAIVAVAVTEVRQFPRCRILEIVLVGGTGLWRWIWQLVAVLDAHAEALGCVDIKTGGRKGWSRFGFTVCGVALVRRLKE